MLRHYYSKYLRRWKKPTFLFERLTGKIEMGAECRKDEMKVFNVPTNLPSGVQIHVLGGLLILLVDETWRNRFNLSI